MNKKIMILGGDGYLGWNLAMYLGVRNNNKITIIDNFSRRNEVVECGSDSLTPIRDIHTRIKTYNEIFNKKNIKFICGNVLNKEFVFNLLKKEKPDVIVNFAQMPSAPYSMINAEKATWTTNNNVNGNLNVLWGIKKYCPDAHLIKMGTMGEYGTPPVDIPEGFFDNTATFRGRSLEGMTFPRKPGSFYHCAKVFESMHTHLCCNMWGLKATDLMQGVIFGVTTEESEKDEKLLSRFDYDGVFGTAINRFVVQTLCGYKLSPFGKGKQIRGFINIKDAMKCIELYIENPPKKGEYRVFNQLAEVDKTVFELAEMIARIGSKLGYISEVESYENPRIELEEHYYNPDHQKVIELGLVPHNMEKEIEKMFTDLKPFQDRVKKEAIDAKIKWNQK